ncbi:MAG: DUF2059 domain-containing protein [Pseudomonadota bacterium]
MSGRSNHHIGTPISRRHTVRAALWGLVAFSTLLGLAARAGTFESARRLVDLLGVEATVEETIIAAVEDARNQLLSRGVPAETVNKVADVIRDEMLAGMPDLLDDVTLIYAEEFTEEELTDLIRFFETPTGQKFAATQRTIDARIGSALGSWLADVRDRARERLLSAASA